MTLVRYQPWSVFDSLHRDINRLFDDRKGGEQNLFAGQWSPSVDIKEEAEALVVLADLPGVAPEQIEVTAHNGVLTIKGERQFNKEEKEKDFHRIERSYGSFLRQFTLPDNIDAEHIAAKSNNGVLEIRLPKSTGTKAKRVRVEY